MIDEQTRRDALIIKRCTKCKRDLLMCEWRQLPRIGFQVGVEEGDRLVPKELRNCECGSTLSLTVDLEIVIAIAISGPDRDRTSAARTAIELLQRR